MLLPIVIISTIILFSAELLYFKIANHYNIIDKPNHRSSHTKVTIRGGGVIFAFALLVYSLYAGLTYPYFLLGLLLISFISFMDDIQELSSKVRILFHLAAVALLFYQTGLFMLPVYWIALSFIFVIGTINAINFMDGINGITGGYGLVALATLYYINASVAKFTDPGFLLTAILAVLVFNFFNFRTKAKCFAGDVGSVSLAFIILFFLLQLIIKTENLSYIVLLLLYGLDAVTTIAFRLIRKENIFEAHRSHFYQFLVNERKIPHVWVASFYALVQLVMNILLIICLPKSNYGLFLSLLIISMIFISVRLIIEGPRRLFNVTE
ncbi:MraY family glycosyltransferase [Mucilaginibacter arboris]|uniref:UDP-GlcNAc--UDP-phosphate GlcNAc-1-phosphate transferase n=1 Tax=Mucilaginibacter arboris TaxID=2682090 RepID=A0A7K1SUQ7_9SPHI|nr:glycosyltransferase family 4 protein [Mucilaginibacter arboris]MVN20997.1 UDP-GlcNAc--UDP-phosphate GlcNAc-1-phosphate transferase [Mucilaginibacter arboris]